MPLTKITTDNIDFSSNLVFSNVSSMNVTTLNAGDVQISGNLTVSGTTVTVNTNVLDVKDLNITVAKGAGSSALSNSAGLTVDFPNAQIFYTSSDDSWNVNKSFITTNTVTIGTSTYFVSNGFVGIGTSTPSYSLHIQRGTINGGIFIEDSNASLSSPLARVQGRRSDGNSSQSFSGGLALERYRTLSGLTLNNILGTIYFGGNYDTTPNFTYPASISAVAEGTWTSTTDAAAGLSFRTGSTGQSLGTTNVSFGTERMRIDNTGVIGIGTAAASGTVLRISRTADAAFYTDINAASPVNATVTGNKNHYYSVASSSSNSGTPYTVPSISHFIATAVAFDADTTVTNQYGFSANAPLTGATNNYGFYGNIPDGTGRWNFYANGTAPNYFAGNLRIGTVNSYIDAWNTNQNIILSGTGTPGLTIAQASNATTPPVIAFAKSRGTTPGDWTTPVQSGDNLGVINFVGAEGSTRGSGARIQAQIDNTVSSGVVPASIQFLTSQFSTGSLIERLRIDSEGRMDMRSSMNPMGIGSASSISGTTLTVGGTVTGTFRVGDRIFGNGVEINTFITALGTGTGGAGTYTINNSQTVASAAMNAIGGGFNVFRFTDTDTTSGINQPMGVIEWYNSDASTPGAGVKAYIAGISESTTPDTSLVFGTSDNVASTQARERMRIDSSGRVGIGVTSPNAGLDINLGSYDAGYASIRLPNGGNYILLGDRGVVQGWPSEGLAGTYFGHNFVHQGGVGFKNIANDGYSGSYSGTSYWAVFTGGSPGAAGTTFALTERFRINAAGQSMFGTTDPIDHRVTIGGYSAAWGIGFKPTGVYPANSNQYGYAIFRNSSGTGTGNISGNESSVTYSTSSDYRLKTNLEPLTSAVSRIKNIPVYRFNWLIDPEGDKVDGFLAHEVQEIVPQAVIGEKDAVFPDGKINSQSIDHSKMIPLLTAAIQELNAKVEALQAQLEAKNV